ncbi:MAG: hypothetical protein NVS3B21_22470 [Acidimicrobiales bacterium]
MVKTRPTHPVDVGITFRAFTRERVLLPDVLVAGEHLDPELRDLALAGRGFDLDDEPTNP